MEEVATLNKLKDREREIIHHKAISMNIIGIVFILLLNGQLLSQPTMSLEGIESFSLDKYSIDGGRYKKARAFLTLFNRDSVWLMEGSENLVMKFTIYDDFKEGRNMILLVRNISLLDQDKEIFEMMVIGKEVELYMWTGRVLRFHIKGRKKW